MTNDPLKHLADTGAAGLIAGSLVGWLPTIAAILGAAWYAVQLYESQTGQKLVAWIKRTAKR